MAFQNQTPNPTPIPPAAALHTGIAPSCQWSLNDHALTRILLHQLQLNTGVRAILWPRIGDPPSRRTKASASRELAQKIFADLPEYKEFVNADLKYYACSTLGKVWGMRKRYQELKEKLEAMKASQNSEESVKLFWESIKEEYPYYLLLLEVSGDKERYGFGDQKPVAKMRPVKSEFPTQVRAVNNWRRGPAAPGAAPSAKMEVEPKASTVNKAAEVEDGHGEEGGCGVEERECGECQGEREEEEYGDETETDGDKTETDGEDDGNEDKDEYFEADEIGDSIDVNYDKSVHTDDELTVEESQAEIPEALPMIFNCGHTDRELTAEEHQAEIAETPLRIYDTAPLAPINAPNTDLSSSLFEDVSLPVGGLTGRFLRQSSSKRPREESRSREDTNGCDEDLSNQSDKSSNIAHALRHGKRHRKQEQFYAKVQERQAEREHEKYMINAKIRLARIKYGGDRSC